MTQSIADLILDDGESEAYAPDLYHFDGVADYVADFASIGEDEIARFHEQGYLAVERAFSVDEVNDALAGLLHLLSGEVTDFKGVQYEKVAQIMAAVQRAGLRKIGFPLDPTAQ
jgi:hypothetical protein